MRETTRANRLAVPVDPLNLTRVARTRGMWYETPEEIEAGLAWGERKAELLRWLELRIERRLTRHERRCVELRYFEGFSCEEIAGKSKITASSVRRALARALRKLRHSARGCPLRRKTRAKSPSRNP